MGLLGAIVGALLAIPALWHFQRHNTWAAAAVFLLIFISALMILVSAPGARRFGIGLVVGFLLTWYLFNSLKPRKPRPNAPHRP